MSDGGTIEDDDLDYERVKKLAKEYLAFLKSRCEDPSGPTLEVCIAAGLVYAGLFCDDPPKAMRILNAIFGMHGAEPPLGTPEEVLASIARKPSTARKPS